ncbi:MAG TPA: VOC family protein [Ferruginibacter sp.]|nr:VOC family protein [Ferruginibacter sp.]HPH92939.1 VOC family protein [Ferruginibacter sp.]
MKIPPQYNRLMPYLIIPNAARFIEFMKQVFGATEQMRVPGEDGTVMHGEIRLGETVIMLAEASDQFKAKPAGMFIYVQDLKEVYEKAIQAGAVSIMEPMQKDYGFTCGFSDPFGNDWWPTEV